MTWPFTIIPVAFSLIPFFLVFLFLYLLVYWLGRREQRALCMYGLFTAVVTAPPIDAGRVDSLPNIDVSIFMYLTLPAWGMFILSTLSLLKSRASKRYTACWLAATALYLFNAVVYTLWAFNKL